MALILTLALGSAFYLQAEKRVTLSVDGEGRTVRTFAPTVGDLLAREGLEVGEHDEIAPPPDAELTEGMEVEVLVAKEITLVLNGEERTVFVTGTTVEEVLEHVNLRSGGGAFVQPSRGAPIADGDTIVYRDAMQVTVSADGDTREIITNAPDVGYLLDSMGIVIRRRDRVTPRVGRALQPGMEIVVARIRVREVTEEQTIPFDTRVQKSDEMYQGERKVTREGSTGLERNTFRVRYRDGEEVSRTLLAGRVLREPVDEIVVEGTKPRSTNSQSGIASWYHRDGMTAAHKTLPFGTRVTVTNVANGRSVTVVIDDRGPFVEGRIIDLSDDAFARLAPLSRGTVNVRISW